MADVQYRGNLKAASFPFLSELHGRSVIVKGQDQNYIAGLAAKEAIDSVAGVPQIYYCHNVIPVDNGYRAISYIDYVTTEFQPAAGFSDTYTIRDGLGNSASLAMDAVGNVYVMETGTTTWIAPTGGPLAADVAGKRITVAFVSGVSYIFFQGVGCYTYDFTLGTFSSVTLTGITAADIIGLVGNSGYLIAYSVDAFAWSSVTDITDFTPSLETGAGGGQIEGLRGTIVTVVEIYGGLIIFGSDNCIAASYSGNPRFPYGFTAIPGASGLSDYRYVTSDIGQGTVYAYTESGVQAVTLRNATSTFPEVTDFLSGKLFETFNESTNTLESVDAAGGIVEKRVTLISNRYIVISYGVGALTDALYYDIAYKQWGRLKLDHVDCFEFMEYPTAVQELPKRSIAFLTSSGDIKILNSDINNTTASGVMLLGKFQYVRTRVMQLQSAEIENINQNATFTLLDFPSLDGKNFQPAVEGYLAESTGKFRKYNFHSTALNHTLGWKGNFNAVSFVLTFNVGGGR